MSARFVIYADGSSISNPGGPGGTGYVVLDRETSQVRFGALYAHGGVGAPPPPPPPGRPPPPPPGGPPRGGPPPPPPAGVVPQRTPCPPARGGPLDGATCVRGREGPSTS